MKILYILLFWATVCVIGLDASGCVVVVWEGFWGWLAKIPPVVGSTLGKMLLCAGVVVVAVCAFGLLNRLGGWVEDVVILMAGLLTPNKFPPVVAAVVVVVVSLFAGGKLVVVAGVVAVLTALLTLLKIPPVVPPPPKIPPVPVFVAGGFVMTVVWVGTLPPNKFPFLAYSSLVWPPNKFGVVVPCCSEPWITGWFVPVCCCGWFPWANMFSLFYATGCCWAVLTPNSPPGWVVVVGCWGFVPNGFVWVCPPGWVGITPLPDGGLFCAGLLPPKSGFV